MTILGILLTILKIIGIILLVLLLLILTVILLILFVPFRYRVHADKVGWDMSAGASVSWLLRMIQVDVAYGIRESGYGGGLTKDIRIFGISIFRIKDWISGRRKKKAKAAGESAETFDAGAGSDAAESPDTGTDSNFAETPDTVTGSSFAEAPDTVADSGFAEAPDAVADSGFAETGETKEPLSVDSENESDLPEEDEETENRSLPGRVFGLLETVRGLLLSLPGRIYEILITIFTKILEFFTILCGIPGRIVALFGQTIDKVLTVRGKITLITDFFFDDRTQDAIHLLFGKTGNLLGHVRPRKLSGYLDFGFDDPSITGRVLGILSLFLPQVGKTFDINPDFEKSHLECDITSSGRIYLFYLIYIAASTYFNKNIKYVIRYVRHLRKELSQA